ncbi:YopX family protein [Lysinibacillus sp. NPDC093712]|uniref:YopX family protein n=1 Tax=Lysinibacillus sp. NPDC093712 TaxID=3390579 RepID=UPI003D0513BD
MSREIKFRAWDKCSEYMHSNVQSGVYEDPDDWTEFNTVLGLERFEVMQYTGLKDKNGKEIYEGDIESDENGNLSVVCYLQKYGAYCFVPVVLYLHENYETEVNYEYGTDCYFHNAVPSIYSEVVGNIYENPELLEETA